VRDTRGALKTGHAPQSSFKPSNEQRVGLRLSAITTVLLVVMATGVELDALRIALAQPTAPERLTTAAPTGLG